MKIDELEMAGMAADEKIMALEEKVEALEAAGGGMNSAVIMDI